MAHPNEDLVREGFAAFGRGDMDALPKYWTDDIRFHVPGRHPAAGDYQGIEQALQFHARMAELSRGTVSTEVNDVLANDERVVVLLTARGERAVKQMNVSNVTVYNFRDGKLAEVVSHSADQYAVDEFYS